MENARAGSPDVDLSVVIVNYNAGHHLTRALESLARHLADLPHEVIVVDNRSADGSVEAAARAAPGSIVLRNDRNVGFAAALNRGLAASRGRHLLWMNPDAMLLDRGLVDLVRYLDATPEVGIVGPQLVDPDGAVQLSCRAFPSYGAAIGHRYSLLTRLFPNNPYSRHYLRTDFDHRAIADVDWVSGACLLQRREVSDRIGPLDERFFMYCEDVDFCLRATEAGWKVRYHPGARVQHRIATSASRAARPMIVARHRSMWRYYLKHFRRHPLKDVVTAAGIFGRCGWLLVRDALGARLLEAPKRPSIHA